MRGLLSSLRRDTEGVTAVEFGLVAPILLIGMMGVFDLGHNMYTASVLNGAIQKVARDSTIENAAGQEAELDRKVTEMVQRIAPGASTEFERKSYTSFTDATLPEDFDDVNGDGTCNDGEPFEDANSNGSWDASRGKTGFGGARDAVLYQVTVTYDRVFPLAELIGQDDEMTLVVRTVLRNQPYGGESTAPPTGNCP